MFVSEFAKFATTVPPEKVDGQPKATKQDSFLADAIRQHGIPITITDYETGVEEEPLPKAAGQARHTSGKFSTRPEDASNQQEHEAAANYHSQKEGSKHADATQAHQVAADAHKRNSPIASAYTEAAQQASQVANKE